MGRITIFATDGCPHCKRVKTALTSRGIPYKEISVTRYPQKRKDMLAVSDRISTPQVFFNTRHVGGADDTIAQLEKWDRETAVHKSPFERYTVEIANQFDPSNPRLALPTEDPVEPEPSPPREQEKEFCVTLPDDRKVTVVETIETLKRIVPSKDNMQKLTCYKMSFTGKEAVGALCTHFGIATGKAIAFGRRLQAMQVLTSVRCDSAFDKTDTIFRLYCYNTPDTLNTYRVWTDDIDPEPMRLLNLLTHLMRMIEAMVTDGDGNIDYDKAVTLPLYTMFEEAICALQLVDLEAMDDKTKTAFGINVYNLMVKYAFMKVGAGATDLARLAFYNNVKFNIGGFIFNFQDWENGILRGNKKAPYALKLQFDQKDPRLMLAIKEPDFRLHFGLNCGARSCPPVNNYTVENLDEELKMAANAFCEDEFNVSICTRRKQLSVSKIFQWYKTDFAENNKELPSAVLPYLRRVKHQELDRLVDSDVSIKVVFKHYDWSSPVTNVKTFDMSDMKANCRSFKGLVGSKFSKDVSP